MSKIYNIGLFDSSDNCVNWFGELQQYYHWSFCGRASSKIFFHLDHAKNCVDQFIKKKNFYDK